VTGTFLALGVALLLANAFFVAVEFALVASRRSALEPMAEAGDRSARRSLVAVDDLNLQLAGSQLGITMASLGLGAVAEPALAHVIESAIEQFGEVPDGVVRGIGFVVALSIVVFLHLVVGEMVPKSIAIAAPEEVLRRLSGLNRAYMVVFGPVIRVLNALANVGMRLIRVEPVDDRLSIHTAEELAGLLAQGRALVDQELPAPTTTTTTTTTTAPPPVVQEGGGEDDEERGKGKGKKGDDDEGDDD